MFVFVGTSIMRDRSAINIKPLAVAWNGALALFSFAGLKFYVWDYLWDRVVARGVSHVACNVDTEYDSPWLFMFCLSKIPELFDTVLYVAKKQKIIFLHWYHHASVMWFCWFAWAYAIENGEFFAAINSFDHALMYSYFAFVAFGIRFPNPIRMMITTLQIIQMVLGTILVTHNLIICNRTPYIQLGGLGMYISYAILFCDFFRNQYIAKKAEITQISHRKHA